MEGLAVGSCQWTWSAFCLCKECAFCVQKSPSQQSLKAGVEVSFSAWKMFFEVSLCCQDSMEHLRGRSSITRLGSSAIPWVQSEP